VAKFENDDDFSRQKAVERLIELSWHCKCLRIPYEYVLDNVCVRQTKVLAYTEIKVRNYLWSDHEAIFLSLNKIMMAQAIRKASEVPTYLVVSTSDGLVHWTTIDRTFKNVVAGPKKEKYPRDRHECEPSVLIPREEFSPLATK
jgi:hypothetical protein